jgi:hypothetical protein
MSSGAVDDEDDGRMSIRVMTYNIWYGGEQVNLRDTADAIKNAKPDIVGVQECDANLHELASLCGLPYVDERRHIISRFPIFDSGGTGRRTEEGSGAYSIHGLDSEAVHAWILIAPGKVIAFANTHQDWDPYGPDFAALGVPNDELLVIEENARGEDTRALANAFRGLAKTITPFFLTGDFNCPSHLDWTDDMIGVLPQITCSFDWPSSLNLRNIGLIDSFRSVHPHPEKKPGITFGLDLPDPVLPTPTEEEVAAAVEQQTIPLLVNGGDQFRDRIDFVYVSGDVEVLDSWVVSKTKAAMIDERRGGISRAVSNFPWPSDHCAVMTFALVRPVTAPPLINVKQRRFIRYKEQVTVSITVPDGDSWSVAIVASGGNALVRGEVLVGMYNEPLIYRRSVRFGTNILPPGEYDAVLLSVSVLCEDDSTGSADTGTGGTDETVARIAQPEEELCRVRFAVISDNSLPSLSARVSVETCDSGGNEATSETFITIEWKDSAGDKHDFLSIYNASNADLNTPRADIYTGGHFSGTVKISMTDKAFMNKPLERGWYNVLFITNDEYVELARTSFEID